MATPELGAAFVEGDGDDVAVMRGRDKYCPQVAPQLAGLAHAAQLEISEPEILEGESDRPTESFERIP